MLRDDYSNDKALIINEIVPDMAQDLATHPTYISTNVYEPYEPLKFLTSANPGNIEKLVKSKGGTTSLKCRRLFYWRAPEMVGSVFLCPQQICPPAANVPAVTNLLSLYHPHTYAIGGRRLLIYFSALLFVSKSVRSVTLYGRDGDKYWWK